MKAFLLVVSDILDPAFNFMHLFFNEMAIAFKAVNDFWFVWSVAALDDFRCTQKNHLCRFATNALQ